MILERVERVAQLRRGTWCWLDGLVVTTCPSRRHPLWVRPPIIALGTWRRALALHLDGTFSIDELRCSCGWRGSIAHSEVCPSYDVPIEQGDTVRAA